MSESHSDRKRLTILLVNLGLIGVCIMALGATLLLHHLLTARQPAPTPTLRNTLRPTFPPSGTPAPSLTPTVSRTPPPSHTPTPSQTPT
ncbi:MAG: hypothetical protein JXA78_09475, partial [Anaerolineales bacterium]|nr:hypothetical protein [Anaerolineales bacterium]